MPGRRRSEISDLSARSCNSRHGFRAHSGSACGSFASSRTARYRTSIEEVLRDADDAGGAPFGAAATSSTLASLPRGPPQGARAAACVEAHAARRCVVHPRRRAPSQVRSPCARLSGGA